MEYRVNTDLILDLAGQIQLKHEDILGTIGELRSVNDALDGAWDGEAQVQFETSFGDWLVQLEQFSGTLESVHQYLVTFVDARLDLEEQARNAAAGATS